MRLFPTSASMPLPTRSTGYVHWIAQCDDDSNRIQALAEGHACEQSARQNAMDNASKNAGDMINKFQILYNRTRQAVITGELVEIITGAAASES